MSTPFVDECVAVLRRTPATLNTLLRDLPDSWTHCDEGPGTWTPITVIGHLNHGERADWIPRLERILTHGTSLPFDPFDRNAQFTESEGKSLTTLLDEFIALRQAGLTRLAELDLQPHHLELTGTHPAFGPVTARQLLATWTAHDLSHVVQIGRTLAKHYQQEVGPWAEYLSVMK